MHTDAAFESAAAADGPDLVTALTDGEPPSPVLEIAAPDVQTGPVIFASPHSGRDYPPDLLVATRLDPLTLRRSEDCYVDELFGAAPACGAPLLKALFPRAYCDVNRDPGELDPALFLEAPPATALSRSPRVHAGLGVIARVVRDGADIYRRRMPLAEGRRRLAVLHTPYHAALTRLIETTRERFGQAILIDCHSMPSQAAVGGVDMILGDRYGASCAPGLTGIVTDTLTALGFRVGRNNPYAGGYTAETYGAPAKGVHVLQIEVNRALYLDEVRLERLPGFGAIQARLTRFIDTLAAHYAG
jgi:N-formylglutamate amidohydrolase